MLLVYYISYILNVNKKGADVSLEIAEKLARKLESLGFSYVTTSGSNQSSSAYVSFTVDTEPFEEDAVTKGADEDDAMMLSGNLETTFKVRISDHDIPSHRDKGDYEINTSSQLRHESHSDDWKDAISFANRKRDEIRSEFDALTTNRTLTA